MDRSDRKRRLQPAGAGAGRPLARGGAGADPGPLSPADRPRSQPGRAGRGAAGLSGGGARPSGPVRREFDPAAGGDAASREAAVGKLVAKINDLLQGGEEPRPRPRAAADGSAGAGDQAHQLLPDHRRRGAQGAYLDQDRLAGTGRPAPAQAVPRDLRLGPAYRRRPPAIRPGGAGRTALVRPPRRLPHRGSGSGEGPAGQERRHRARRLQGRLLPQTSCGHRPRRGRPRRPAGRGDPRLQDLPVGPAGHHRQHRRVRGCHPSAERRPVRGRRSLSGRGRRQGHGDLLGHRQRHFGRLRLLAGRRLRQWRIGRLRPQGHGHHRPRCLGGGQASLPRDGQGHPVRALYRGRRRRHVGRRIRQRHAAVEGDQTGRRLRPPRHLHRPQPRPGLQLGRARPDVQTAALVLAGLRQVEDFKGRWCLPALGQVDRAEPRDQGRARHPGRRGRSRDPDEGHPAGPGRTALFRRHRHLCEGAARDRRPGRRQGQ